MNPQKLSFVMLKTPQEPGWVGPFVSCEFKDFMSPRTCVLATKLSWENLVLHEEKDSTARLLFSSTPQEKPTFFNNYCIILASRRRLHQE